MAKKKSWLDRLKSLFVSESKAKSDKKEKRKGWLFGRFKSKYSPALPAPSLIKPKSHREVEQEQSKHALAVAVATAAAAEAAVAAAQAAAQVVRLTGIPSYHQDRETAAIKIQNTFRGYLARKALRAMKGLVRLQALIRGQAVRRQTNATLRGLQSLMKIQSQARRASKSRITEAYEYKDIVHVNLKELADTKRMLQQDNGRMWNNSALSKEEINAILESRREAALKRLRALEYASSCQERRNWLRPNTPTPKRVQADDSNPRWSRLEQWVGAQPPHKDLPEIYLTPSRDKLPHDQELHLPNTPTFPDSQDKSEVNELRYLARRSFNRSRKASTKEYDSLSSSPAYPNYMASTVSTKVKFRSMSTPKQRVGADDIWSEHCTSNLARPLSAFPSIVSDASFIKASSKTAVIHQRSPRLKGQTTVAAKSRRTPYYHSIDSEHALLNWDQRDAFR